MSYGNEQNLTENSGTFNNENETASAAPLHEYGKMLAEKIRTTVDFAKLTDYEKFILDRGWEFKTEESFRAGYDRLWKCKRDILITEDEFIAESTLRDNGFIRQNETTRAVYNTLVELVKSKKLKAAEVYRYAHYKWCLCKPSAIIAYQEGRDRWEVNNCETEVSESEAQKLVNREWGFEVNRIEIIGTPYYDATDYQFIRFDCAHMSWLWKNSSLYQVYE